MFFGIAGFGKAVFGIMDAPKISANV